MPRSSEATRNSASRLLISHSTEGADAPAPASVRELEAGLLSRIEREGVRSEIPLTGLLALAEAANDAEWESC